MTIATSVSAVVVVVGLAAVTASVDSDLTGSFCAVVGCCAARRDHCSAPILDTLCYCDGFCDKNRTASASDCCPDYWSVCKGAESPVVLPFLSTPPPSQRWPPTDVGQNSPVKQYCSYGQTVDVNCNRCVCRETDGKTELRCSSDECLVDPFLLDELKNNRFGWSANNYSEFWGRTYDDGLKLRLGTLQSSEKMMVQTLFPTNAFRRNPPEPTYDLREVWGDRISRPTDQGWCGASWAVTTVQVTADRFGVTGRGDAALSAQQLLSCDARDQRGCEGGRLTDAWNWVRKYGLVTEECYPWTGRTTACATPKRRRDPIAACPRATPYRRGPAETSRLHRVTRLYRVTTEDGIMYEIKNWGSVQATMKVSKDFFVYESGVYRCSDLASGSRTGYHAVRIVGWGEEYQNGRKVKYWIVSNSWGTWWGENGYFRILKGVNECEIEDFVVAARPDVDGVTMEETNGLDYRRVWSERSNY